MCKNSTIIPSYLQPTGWILFQWRFPLSNIKKSRCTLALHNNTTSIPGLPDIVNLAFHVSFLVRPQFRQLGAHTCQLLVLLLRFQLVQQRQANVLQLVDLLERCAIIIVGRQTDGRTNRQIDKRKSTQDNWKASLRSTRGELKTCRASIIKRKDHTFKISILGVNGVFSLLSYFALTVYQILCR